MYLCKSNPRRVALVAPRVGLQCESLNFESRVEWVSSFESRLLGFPGYTVLSYSRSGTCSVGKLLWGSSGGKDPSWPLTSDLSQHCRLFWVCLVSDFCIGRDFIPPLKWLYCGMITIRPALVSNERETWHTNHALISVLHSEIYSRFVTTQVLYKYWRLLLDM